MKHTFSMLCNTFWLLALLALTTNCENPDKLDTTQPGGNSKKNNVTRLSPEEALKEATRRADSVIQDPSKADEWYQEFEQRAGGYAKARAAKRQAKGFTSDKDSEEKLFLDPWVSALQSAKKVIAQDNSLEVLPSVIKFSFPFINSYGSIAPTPLRYSDEYTKNLDHVQNDVKDRYEKIFGPSKYFRELHGVLEFSLKRGTFIDDPNVQALRTQYPRCAKIAQAGLEALRKIYELEHTVYNGQSAQVASYNLDVETEEGQKEALRYIKRVVILLLESSMALEEEMVDEEW